MSEDKNKDNQDSSSNDKKSKQQDPPATIVEWTVRGVSFLIVLSLLGYFGYTASQPNESPFFECNVIGEEIEQRGNGWVMPVEVQNKGDISVSNVNVIVEEPNRSSLVVKMLGSKEKVKIEFWFDERPSPQTNVLVGSYILL